METEHGASCLRKLLKNWVVYCVWHVDTMKELFTFGDEALQYPDQFKPLYKINVRLK